MRPGGPRRGNAETRTDGGPQAGAAHKRFSAGGRAGGDHGCKPARVTGRSCRARPENGKPGGSKAGVALGGRVVRGGGPGREMLEGARWGWRSGGGPGGRHASEGAGGPISPGFTRLPAAKQRWTGTGSGKKGPENPVKRRLTRRFKYCRVVNSASAGPGRKKPAACLGFAGGNGRGRAAGADSIRGRWSLADAAFPGKKMPEFSVCAFGPYLRDFPRRGLRAGQGRGGPGRGPTGGAPGGDHPIPDRVEPRESSRGRGWEGNGGDAKGFTSGASILEGAATSTTGIAFLSGVTAASAPGKGPHRTSQGARLAGGSAGREGRAASFLPSHARIGGDGGARVPGVS